MAFDPDKIAEKIDRALVAGIEFDDNQLGLGIKNLIDAMEFAKVMAISKQAIPEFLRGEPGLCVAIVTRSLRWGLDPFFVAEQAYPVVNPKTKEEKIAFMAQLFNAVINKAQPLILKGPLRIRYEGDGDDLRGIVYGTPLGEIDPLEYETPTIGQRIAAVGRNDYGRVKGSPLYEQDPKQALWYYGSRGIIRRHWPHVLAGAYSQEEMQEAGWERMKDVTPRREGDTEKPKAVTSLADRLREKKAAAVDTSKKGRGFDPEHVERETAGNGGAKEDVASGDVEVKEQNDGGKAEIDDGAGAAAGGSGGVREDSGNADDQSVGGTDDASARGSDDRGDREAETATAGGDAPQASQQELLPPEPDATTRRRKR